MAEIRVRNLEDWVVARFKAQAKRHGRSLEAEMRELFQKEAKKNKKHMTLSLRKNLSKLKDKYGVLPDSTAGIRADRDKNG